MPLFNEGLRIDASAVKSVTSFPLYVEKAVKFHQLPTRNIGPEGLLYVNQREFAAVSPENAQIKVLGTADATTCHIVVIRHTGSGAVSLGHFDGCDSKHGIEGMIESVKKLSYGKPDGRIDLFLFGGFNDDRGESEKLSKELLGILMQCPDELHLQQTCITDLNDTLKGNDHFPIIYGIGAEVLTGDIFSAHFSTKEPDLAIRSACHFTGFQKMLNIYSNNTEKLVIGPYMWEAWHNIDQYLALSDPFIRRYLSTSPRQEPIQFEAQVREALTVIQQHPIPAKSLFPNFQPRVYEMDSSGRWQKVTE